MLSQRLFPLLLSDDSLGMISSKKKKDAGDDDDDEGEGEGDGGEGTSDFSDETPPSPSCNRLPLNGNPSLAHPPCLHSLQQSELSSSEG